MRYWLRGVGLIGLLVGAGILILLFFFIAIIYSYFFARKGRSIMFREFYECGFKAIPDNRVDIDIQFSGLMIVFLIYDMEIIFLTPVLVNLYNLSHINLFAEVFCNLWYSWS